MAMATSTKSNAMTALLISTLVVTLCSVPTSASRFTFTLSSRVEECFLEEVDARTSDNKMLFRFGIMEPESYDFMDVQIKSPSWAVVEAWNKTQINHVSTTVRETGLYHLCFRKRAGSSKDIEVFYSFDFISTGSVSLTLYPAVAATIDKSEPDNQVYSSAIMSLSTKKGEATKMGVVDFNLDGVSSSILHSNTRVQLLLSVDYLSKPKLEVAVARVQRKVDYPVSWNSMGAHPRGDYKAFTFDSAVTEIGSHLSFDVTEIFSEALNQNQKSVAFSLHANEDSEAAISTMSHVSADFFPQLVVEDLGLGLMREVSYFKESVFTLRGDISYILQKERGSRNAAESTNSRIMWTSLLVNLVLVGIALAQASRFTFTLTSRAEECFMEDVDARTSDNKILFRFGIVEPEPYDFINVQIKSPSWKTVESWNKTQANHMTTPVRETGLYHVCFSKRAGASKELNVYYSFDFISTGSVSLTLYPGVAATVDKAQSDQAVYTVMSMATKKGEATKMGVLEFELTGVSSSILHSNTRVQLLMSVDYLSKKQVEISVARVPQKLVYPLSWDSMGAHARGDYKAHTFDGVTCEVGTHLSFDVTEMFAEALNNGLNTIAFSVHASEDADATISGLSYVTTDYFPQLVVEDLGLDLMREVAYFKETVFTLKGDISYILQRERGSRNLAESTNSRIKWLSMMVNVVLVGIAFAQVVYIRGLLENSY
ncbi:TPA: hypothetical protein N0F65_005207 [Lagenidium giganteum]|uniref:GOLD domain-containing protein n=1 Tax=Lagenidium giganteum TaxID=4803 RepID=A0AAV2Z0L7_9STRA|nr:TPA: hypothetical protein N0F65_005207 [Lagenidium giganteum]